MREGGCTQRVQAAWLTLESPWLALAGSLPPPLHKLGEKTVLLSSLSGQVVISQEPSLLMGG